MITGERVRSILLIYLQHISVGFVRFRVLGFHRVPPVSGRVVNMTSELFMLAEKALKKTFYVSPSEYLSVNVHLFTNGVDKRV